MDEPEVVEQVLGEQSTKAQSVKRPLVYVGEGRGGDG